jgi:hypothetical protein
LQQCDLCSSNDSDFSIARSLKQINRHWSLILADRRVLQRI